MGCQFVARLPSSILSGFPENSPVLIGLPGGEGHCESKVFHPRTQPSHKSRDPESSLLKIRPPRLHAQKFIFLLTEHLLHSSCFSNVEIDMLIWISYLDWTAYSNITYNTFFTTFSFSGALSKSASKASLSIFITESKTRKAKWITHKQI